MTKSRKMKKAKVDKLPEISMVEMLERMKKSAAIRRAQWREIAKDYLTPEQIFALPETRFDNLVYKFDTLSLSAWLEIIKLAGVPYIPAFVLGKIPQKQFWDVVDGKFTDAHVDSLEINQELQNLPDNWMIRWDHCA
jgi:hypothetical protein